MTKVTVELPDWIAALTGDDDGLLTSEQTKRRCFCHMRGGIVDEDARTLRCRRCGQAMDPYPYLAFLARKQAAELEEQIKRLKQQAARLKKKATEE